MNNLVNPLRDAGVSAVIFLLVSLPQVYSRSNNFLSEEGDCPNYKSKLIHFVAFLVLAVLTFKYVLKLDKDFSDMLGYALYAALLYFLISSPEMYQLTNSLVGNSVKLVDGACPTFNGVFVHTAVFAVTLASWHMYFPKENIFA
jgi:hypothetical protein